MSRPHHDPPAGPGGTDLHGAVTAVREARTTAAALLADAARRLERAEPELGAVVEVLTRPPGDAGPLHGAVLGVKELLAVAGVVRGCGAAAFLGDPPPATTDATAVTRLVDAGASLLATTTSHPLGYGVTTPATRNPTVPGRTAGGSSGGSAAAVAAGLVHAALGSDTGGSVRIPAACCGVVGLKPSHGAVPRTGLAPLVDDLDTVGVLAASTRDVATVLDVIAAGGGPSGHDGPAGPDDQLVVGVPTELDELPIDPEVRAAFAATLAALAAAGATVIPVGLPGLVDADRAVGLLVAEAAARLHGPALAARGHLLPDDVRERLERAVGLPPERTTWAAEHREAFAASASRAFVEVDVVATPTLTCRVPAADATHVQVAGRARDVTRALTRLTGPWNLLGCPAGSVPTGTDPDGAPHAIQLAGPVGGDRQIVAAMGLVEQATHRVERTAHRVARSTRR